MGLQDLINKYDNGGFSKTGWFQLKDDGDTATVRLLHKGEVGVKDGETDYDFPIYEVHKLDVDGSGRDRTCLCKGESCEFCKSGNKPQLRMFLQMINKDEKDKDKQVQLWEREVKSNTNRLNEHDEILKSNSEMIGAIKELATEVKYMRGDLNETVERLNKLEGKDGDKWDKFKWLIVTGLVTLILGYLAVSVGLK